VSDRDSSCGNCRFFRQAACHRSPPLGHAFIVPQQDALGQPRFEPQTISYWPLVKQNQWCGEWEPRAAGDAVRPDPEPAAPKETKCH
jgi:hypothetical protein